MSVPVIQECEAVELDLPGRRLRWIANAELLGSKYMSVCVTRVEPGKKVTPAHSHPNGEELIYVIHGSGRVLVDGEVAPVKPGTAVLFPQGSIHMLENTGDTELKVICCFVPPSNLATYKFFEGVDFPA